MFFHSTRGGMTKKYVAISTSTGKGSVGLLTQGRTNAVEAIVVTSTTMGLQSILSPKAKKVGSPAVDRIEKETE